jgi:hypothetical protein
MTFRGNRHMIQLKRIRIHSRKPLNMSWSQGWLPLKLMAKCYLAITLFLVFKHKPANVKGETPFGIVFTIHIQHITPIDMILVDDEETERLCGDGCRQIRYQSIGNSWSSHWSLNLGETLPDTKIEIVYLPITPDVTVGKLMELASTV